jgi:hypothetical protein
MTTRQIRSADQVFDAINWGSYPEKFEEEAERFKQLFKEYLPGTVPAQLEGASCMESGRERYAQLLKDHGQNPLHRAEEFARWVTGEPYAPVKMTFTFGVSISSFSYYVCCSLTPHLTQ